MKKYLFILLAMLTMCVSLSSCDSDGNVEIITPTKIIPTASEVIGEWGCERGDYYYNFSFKDSKYSYVIYNIRSKDIELIQSGTYTLSSGIISFTRSSGSSKLSSGEIYWTSDAKRYLHISPIGDFYRVE